MKPAHNVKVSVFCHEKDNEDEKLILDRLKSLFPFDLEKEKIRVNKQSAEGFFGKRITIFDVFLEKEKHTKRFLTNLVSNLGKEDADRCLEELHSRLDDNMDFFLRLDKRALLENNEVVLTDSGDCFHVKISVAVFPKKRSVAEEVVKSILQKKI